MSVLEDRLNYKPFVYPWAYDAWKKQQHMHWLAEEVPMGDDVKDWRSRLNEGEKNLLTQIFRFFTQGDIDVETSYTQFYPMLFKPPELQMMFAGFANCEAIHIDAYSNLIETLGMPDVIYSEFMQYEEMVHKHNFIKGFADPNDVICDMDIAVTIAAFAAFTEGLQLFASFAMLLNFQRFGKMKGMCQIIAWSIRDETLHVESMMTLFHIFIREQKIDKALLTDRIHEICKRMVSDEDAFIDLAYGIAKDSIEGLTADQVKLYIRYIADRRLKQMGLPKLYHQRVNPLSWIDTISGGTEHTNFFENKPTEYTKAATKGTWDDVF